jgi:non-ribosomal peptide synthetase component F
MSRNPLFDIMFVMQNMENGDINLKDLSIKPYAGEKKISKFDLTITAVEGNDEIFINIEYCTKLFRRETIERMRSHLEKVLDSLIRDRSIKLKEIEILRDEEKQ